MKPSSLFFLLFVAFVPFVVNPASAETPEQTITRQAAEIALLKKEVQRLRTELAEASAELKELLDAAEPPGVDQASYEKARHRYARVGDEFIELPRTDLGRKSSRTGKKTGGPQYADPKHLTEIIPAFRIGEYGTMAGCVIVQILGPDEFLGGPPAQRYHLEAVSPGISVQSRRTPTTPHQADARADDPLMHFKGWPTTGHVDGEELKNIQILIVGPWEYVTAIGGKATILNVIPLDRARAGLTKADYAEMLRKQDAPKE